jgi:type IV pilus assembly protein PilC
MATKPAQRDPSQLGSFTYKAIYTPTNAVVQGAKAKMDAYSEAEVRRALNEQGYQPIWIKEIPLRSGISLNSSVGNTALKLKPFQVSNFSRALYQLINAGISMPRALESIGKDAAIPRLSETCNEMAEKIANGAGIAETFAEYPRAFDSIFCGYLSAGEKTGNLPASLARLTVLTEKRSQMRSKIKGVTAYPMIVSAVIAVLVTLIILFLVPQYQKIYASFNAALPAPTQLLITFSNHFIPLQLVHLGSIPVPAPDPVSPLFWVGLIAGSLYWFLRTHRTDPKVGEIVDKVRFHLPISGALTHKLVLYRWTSTLAGALSSNVQTTDALSLAATAAGSRWLRVITLELERGIQSGRPLSEMMMQYTDMFPADVRTMVSTGEEAGETAIMLQSSATALSDEIDAAVSGLSARIEVALLLFMGVTVGSMLVALYLPILHLSATISNAGNSIASGGH